MPVNTTHPEYDAHQEFWTSARDILRGEAAIKAAGERYLPRLEAQTDMDYAGYLQRAAFFNATARTLDGFCGLVFRRPPFVKLPDARGALGRALAAFQSDIDLLGTPLLQHAKTIVAEVLAVGRAGTLIDFASEFERRPYAVRFAAERILNWRTERVRDRQLLTLLVLHEPQGGAVRPADDEFNTVPGEQIRVLKLIPNPDPASPTGRQCVLELWQPSDPAQANAPRVWQRVSQRRLLRRGSPLPLIPFVFHGPYHSQPRVEKPPLADLMAVNLDHYRLDADYKHGLHFTALPTAWVSGQKEGATTLRVGSAAAWVLESPSASAGFLEFKGQGLQSFEHALDRDERLLAVLGTRLLESPKRVGETAEAIQLRQSGEDSILASIASSVSASLTQVLRWAWWWHGTEALPDQVGPDKVTLELNTDYSTQGLAARDLEALVSSWQAKAISRDTLLDLLRRGEILPDGRSNDEERRLVEKT